MSQKERSIFWEIIVSVILSKKVYTYMCPIPNGFRDRAVSLYSSKIVVIRKRYYVLFLILVFIVQVTKFTSYNTFSKIPLSTSVHFATCVRTWHVARRSAS
jgi:hypothetical protein